MITIGVDAHKSLHVAVALDEAGKELNRWRGPNTAQGWRDILDWAQELDSQRQWGIEGAWGYGRRLAQYLVELGETVYEVNGKWTAMGRKYARKLGKADQLDARAVAQVLREYGTDLPMVRAEDETAVLELLSAERESVLAEATRLRNQIHALLVHTEPEYKQRLRSFKTAASLASLEEYQATGEGTLPEARAASIRRLAARLRLTLEQSQELAEQIRGIAGRLCGPLTELCGVNLLTAGMIAGLLGPGQRFQSDAQLASYAGVAPLQASSADRIRHRLNKGGNRRFNAILYRIALTQAHYSEEAKTYLKRRISEGKSRKEAIRALKRYIVRAIWKLWKRCEVTCQDNFAASPSCT